MLPRFGSAVAVSDAVFHFFFRFCLRQPVLSIVSHTSQRIKRARNICSPLVIMLMDSLVTRYVVQLCVSHIVLIPDIADDQSFGFHSCDAS